VRENNENEEVSQMKNRTTPLTVQIPKFTIIIAVAHNLKDLKDCLDSLEHLDFPKDLFHVVLVDCLVVKGLQDFFSTQTQHYTYHMTTLTLPEQANKHRAWLHESRLNESRNLAMQKVSGQYYVFTEDDCIFEPDWLGKFDSELTDDTGALGGPDVLPDGMGWLPRALDCVLSTFLGTAGAKRGDGFKKEWYYPRKENTVIPAKVFEQIGTFPEDLIFGAEIEMARRIRDAGLQIKYLPDNPVWHRRVTTFCNFVRRNIYQAAEKVRLLRRQHAFIKSPHFLVFLAAMTGLLLGGGSLVNGYARSLFWVMIGCYMVLVLFIATSSLIRAHSLSICLGVLLLLPTHHFSIMCGVVKGALSKTAD
jgi:GT2 family glycosyltransferase